MKTYAVKKIRIDDIKTGAPEYWERAKHAQIIYITGYKNLRDYCGGRLHAWRPRYDLPVYHSGKNKTHEYIAHELRKGYRVNI